MTELIVVAAETAAETTGTAVVATGGGIVAANSGGLFGLGLGATIGIYVVGAIAIVGGIYLIYKYVGKNQGKNQENEVNLSALPRDDEKLRKFVMPDLPQQQQLSNFSNVLSISSDQVKELQEEYMCPISLMMMVEPAILNCCNMRNYQKVIIQKWVEVYKNCPFCRKSVSAQKIIDNFALKKSIKMFRKQLARRARKMEQKRIQQDGL